MPKKPVKKSVRKIKNDKVMNIYHPEMADKVEFAFESLGIKYYTFKQDTEGRYGRYIVLQAFLQEYFLRTSLENLRKNIGSLQKWLNPTIGKDGKGQLEIGKCLELLSIMDQQANIAFEPDTVFRLASCLYFDDQEIISGYDRKHNETKIAKWKDGDVTDFFFHKLFQELTGLIVTSKDALINYLKAAPELTKGWRTMEDILSQ